MEKMNRQIPKAKLNIHRERNIQSVLNSIELSTQKDATTFFNKKPRMIFGFSMIIVAVVTVVLINLDWGTEPLPNPIDNNIVLNEEMTEDIVELSYISSSLLTQSFTVQNNVFMQLAKPVKATTLETDIEDVHSYFNTLKVFLDEEPFKDDIEVVELESGDYERKIILINDESSFEFYINIEEENLEGILVIDEVTFTVEGKHEVDEQESKLSLSATNGSDYVDIEYITETTDEEATKKFNVEKSIGGIIDIKEIKVVQEEDSMKVTINDDISKYDLKKKTEDGELWYMLDYTIDGEKGKANIYIDVDIDNNPVYRYEIREGSVSETILIPIDEVSSEEQSIPYYKKTEQQNEL